MCEKINSLSLKLKSSDDYLPVVISKLHDNTDTSNLNKTNDLITTNDFMDYFKALTVGCTVFVETHRDIFKCKYFIFIIFIQY
jgi:hypothetical protein